MTLDADKYSRSISMICPTCGCTQFEFDDAEEGSDAVKCASCHREFTKDELIALNSENISIQVDEVKAEIVSDVGKDFHDTLKRAFAGSKHIKIR